MSKYYRAHHNGLELPTRLELAVALQAELDLTLVEWGILPILHRTDPSVENPVLALTHHECTFCQLVCEEADTIDQWLLEHLENCLELYRVYVIQLGAARPHHGEHFTRAKVDDCRRFPTTELLEARTQASYTQLAQTSYRVLKTAIGSYLKLKCVHNSNPFGG